MSTAAKTISINIRSDEETKRTFSELCNDLGLSVSSALNMIMKSAVRNREIPVKLTTVTKPVALDDLTDEELLESLEESQKQYERGETYTVEELFEHLDEIDKKQLKLRRHTS
ncbi:MAG: type II toxin-antitoxin system RelB/DinJ family antitoxin [Coriobacteriia bacterium]|nr:type II toxin-antitoxin system RelB/DinJ family antitoxin [Coriobacteriia bacterium]